MTAQLVTVEKKPFALSSIHIPCGTEISIPVNAEKLTTADTMRLADAIHQHCVTCKKALPVAEESS